MDLYLSLYNDKTLNFSNNAEEHAFLPNSWIRRC